MNTDEMLHIALEQAILGKSEGGIPIGAALFNEDGVLLGKGRNMRIQENDPSIHAETDAFRKSGRQKDYRKTIMATTLSPCWYCSGLIRQFNIGTVIIGDSTNFCVSESWLESAGIKIIKKDSEECKKILSDYIKENPNLWNEDIGEI